jgi:AraC-like DNA-binding protein
MEITTIPGDLFPQEGKFDRTAILGYRSSITAQKTRITLNTNLFSFLLEGEKTVHYSGKTIRIDNQKFLLLAGNNCLMSEKLSSNGKYGSLLLFFDDKIFNDFLDKYRGLIHADPTGPKKEPVLCFDQDPFIRNFLHSLELMLRAGTPIPKEMQWLKFEELMLYLIQHHPQFLLSFQAAPQTDSSDLMIKTIVENNIHNPITVEELAFLCNMSLSTFKRRFARLYGNSPNKWILQKRMELAADLLRQWHTKPSDVYYQVGYENHSSFTHSFKQVFGLTPSAFQASPQSATLQPGKA